jgi:hypothetical protein
MTCGKGDLTLNKSAYSEFKCDRERLLALVSRDIRLVLIAAILAIALPPSPALLLRALATLMGRI